MYSPNGTDPFEFDITATYSCIEGFYLEGSANRTCGGNGSSIVGTWSSESPRCSGAWIISFFSNETDTTFSTLV